MGTRKQFTPEFKRDAVQELEDGGRPASALAHALRSRYIQGAVGGGGALKMSSDGQIEQTVGVGNHSDANGLLCLSHSSTLCFSDSTSHVWSAHCGTVSIYSLSPNTP